MSENPPTGRWKQAEACWAFDRTAVLFSFFFSGRWIQAESRIREAIRWTHSAIDHQRVDSMLCRRKISPVPEHAQRYWYVQSQLQHPSVLGYKVASSNLPTGSTETFRVSGTFMTTRTGRARSYQWFFFLVFIFCMTIVTKEINQ